MKNLIFTIYFLSLLSYNTHAASDSAFYDIKLMVQGLKASKALLGYHLGDQNFVVDSAAVDSMMGFVHFRPTKKLAQGIYFVATTEGGILFDFVVTDDKNFSIITHINAPYDSANVNNSLENSAFFDYMKIARQTQYDVINMRSTLQMLKRATKDPQLVAEQERKIYEKIQSLDTYIGIQIEKYPAQFTSKCLKTLQNVVIPRDITPYLDDKKPNPAYAFWLRQHFFDNMDYSDDRLLRSTFYTAKLSQFISQVMPSQPDSVKKYLDFMLEKARSNNLIYYTFTLQYLTKLFDENIDAPQSDAFLIHLIDNYHHKIGSGTDTATLIRLDYKANAFRPNLLGNIAPPISLPNTEGVIQRLSDVKTDYTLVIFYSSLCHHCQEAMPRIKDAVATTDSTNMTIFTVCTDGLQAPWKAFLTEMNLSNWTNVITPDIDSDVQKKYAAWKLPVIYLLDKDKKILAKRLKVENLQNIFKAIKIEKK